MPIIKCLICEKEKFHCNARVKGGGGKFCSLGCYHKYQRLHPNKGTFKKGINYGYGFKKGCKRIDGAGSFKPGSENTNWKGGKINHTEGYIMILKPEHPHSNKAGYIFKHRLVAEKALGRYLTKKEIIHHINEIKDDNRIENLYIFPNRGKHISYHILSKNKKIKTITKSNIPNHL